MITNEWQARRTRSWIERFEETLRELDEQADGSSKSNRRVTAERNGVEYQLRQLREELANYEGLQRGERAPTPVGVILGMPRALIETRIALGLTQEQLAELAGMTKQQIQRYEREEYRRATVASVLRIVRALEDYRDTSAIEAPSAARAARRNTSARR